MCIIMNERLFNQRLDDMMIAIEDAIDDSGIDIDCENAGGILTLTCGNNSQIILSRQIALCQLWVAAKSGGFHFNYNEASNQWVCASSKELFSELLNRCLIEQGGESIQITF